MKRNKIGIFFICCGAALILFILLSDWLRGVEFHLGAGQILIVGVGILSIFAGLYLAIFRLPLPKGNPLFWQKVFGKIEQTLSIIENKISSILKSRTLDLLIVSGFALFALIYTLGRWNGSNPFIFLGSDASYVSSYAAALDHPGQFSNDYFLSNQANVESYFAIHIPLIRLLNKLVGGYGNAFLVLLPITIFLILLGFYLVGKRLFNNKGIALLLAIACFPIIYVGGWEYWGLLGDALSRNLVDIFFPWLILLSINSMDKPRNFYILGGVLGLLTYFHSISAAIIFFAISFTYLILSRVPFKKRIGELLINSLIFLTIITPFVIFWRSSTDSAKTIPINYQDSFLTIIKIYGQNHLDTLGISLDLVKQLSISGIIPLALLALFVLLIFRKIKTIRPFKVLGAWLIAILLICLLIPALEYYLDPWLHMISVSMKLVRGLRFIPPVLITFIFLVFFTDSNEKDWLISQYPRTRNFFLGCVVLLSFAFTISANKQDPYFLNEIRCISSGHFVCPTEEETASVDIIKSLDIYTTSDDTILTIPPLNVSFTLAIRYQALRSLGYTRTDVIRMANNPGLQKIVDSTMIPWNSLEHAEPGTQLASYLKLAGEMNADYLIIQKKNFPQESLNTITPLYQNSLYELVKVTNP